MAHKKMMITDNADNAELVQMLLRTFREKHKELGCSEDEVDTLDRGMLNTLSMVPDTAKRRKYLRDITLMNTPTRGDIVD